MPIKNEKGLISVLVTVVIVLALVFSGPVGAVYIGVNIEKTEYNLWLV